ncbi:MAG: site-specific DNA-methyltransferase [Bacteroidales bacterium]|nr:site-specific DNA-methyltransferase [Bacteroidales bacterium]
MKFMRDIPDNYFDLVLADPPYGIDAGKNIFSDLHKKKDWDKNKPKKKYFVELQRISKNQIIWGINYYSYYLGCGRIIWDKDLTPKYENRRSEYEIAFCSFHNRTAKVRYRWIGNVQGKKINWKNEGLDKRIHPTQKPRDLYKWLLTNYAKAGDKIFDSHGGSFSSACACLDMGFSFDGCEIDFDYFNLAIKRLKNNIQEYLEL